MAILLILALVILPICLGAIFIFFHVGQTAQRRSTYLFSILA